MAELVAHHARNGPRCDLMSARQLRTEADNVKQSLDMVTIRVNYRFGGPVVARY